MNVRVPECCAQSEFHTQNRSSFVYLIIFDFRIDKPSARLILPRSLRCKNRREKRRNIMSKRLLSIQWIKPSHRPHTGARKRYKFYTCTSTRYLIRATNVTGVGGLGRVEAYGIWIYLWSGFRGFHDIILKASRRSFFPILKCLRSPRHQHQVKLINYIFWVLEWAAQNPNRHHFVSAA